MNKCFICESTKNLMEVRLTALGDQHWFWLCAKCRKELEEHKGITVCLRDATLVGMPNIPAEHFCDTEAFTYDY